MDIRSRFEELEMKKQQLIGKLEEMERVKPQLIGEINFIEGSLQMLRELEEDDKE